MKISKALCVIVAISMCLTSVGRAGSYAAWNCGRVGYGAGYYGRGYYGNYGRYYPAYYGGNCNNYGYYAAGAIGVAALTTAAVYATAPRPYYAPYAPYYAAPARPVYYGRVVSNPLAVRVQDRLARQGYYRGHIDGVIGSGSRSAIAAYQRDHGLAVTGQINDALIRSLRIG